MKLFDAFEDIQIYWQYEVLPKPLLLILCPSPWHDIILLVNVEEADYDYEAYTPDKDNTKVKSQYDQSSIINVDV